MSSTGSSKQVIRRNSETRITVEFFSFRLIDELPPSPTFFGDLEYGGYLTPSFWWKRLPPAGTQSFDDPFFFCHCRTGRRFSPFLVYVRTSRFLAAAFSPSPKLGFTDNVFPLSAKEQPDQWDPFQNYSFSTSLSKNMWLTTFSLRCRCRSGNMTPKTSPYVKSEGASRETAFPDRG